MRRHHLIDEVKAELDVAWGEIRSAEKASIANGGAMTVDGLHGELRKSMQTAMEKLRILGQCYEHVLACDDISEAGPRICTVLTRRGDGKNPGLDALATRFGTALYACSREDSGRENDRAVRDAWREIEEALRALGRTI